MTVWGIDVSHHDWNRRGGNLDWAKIRDAGVQFVCVRLTYGAPTGYNPASQHGRELVAGALAAGIPLVGGYHNLVHGSATYLRDQADYFLAEIKAAGCNWAMLDVERYEALVERDLAPRWNDVLVFAEAWRARTSMPLAQYIARWVWDPYLGRPNLASLPGALVSARYPSVVPGTLAGLYPGDAAEGWTPYGGRVPDIWQYSSKGLVPGASSTTDLDAFRGTLPELEALLKGETMRSRNMQKLTDQVKARHPGVVIYGIGDEAHKGSASGHNEDDTAGSRPEDQDADNIAEHRAIDVMIGPAFRNADADRLVNALVTVPANRARLLYVIWNGHQWRRNGGWVKEVRTKDPHRDHPHISGEADDDNNTTPWVLDAGAPPQTGGKADVSNFMIQVNGDPTIYLSDGFKYRGLSSWEAFLTYRDVFKWPYIIVPSAGELAVRAGEPAGNVQQVQAILSDEQVARLEAAAKAGALSGGGGIDTDLLKELLDAESISEEEIAERFGATTS